MALNVFYSWQSDSPGSTNRSFIEDALDTAIRAINRDIALESALREDQLVLDKDTKGTPGSPPIVQTIFEKISRASVFVPDLTFLAGSESGRQVSNPNVLIEYGWALKALGHSRIVPVMNAAYGEPSPTSLPFDLRHLRHPITYNVPPNDDASHRNVEKAALASALRVAISTVLEAAPRDPDPPPYPGTPSTTDPSNFLEPGETMELPGYLRTGPQTLYLRGGQHLYLRLIPSQPLAALTSSKQVLDLLRESRLQPMGGTGGGASSQGRNRHGAFVVMHDDGAVLQMTQLFKTGEVWGIDCITIHRDFQTASAGVQFGYFPCVALEQVFVNTLRSYMTLAESVSKLTLPLTVAAGATGVRGYRMTAPTGMHIGHQQFGGQVVEDNISWAARIESYDSAPLDVLMPFFRHVWEECGLERPDKDSLG